MNPLDLVKLLPLMRRTSGRKELKVALIDGPVVMDHPDLTRQNIQPIGGPGACSRASSIACTHGTFVAGILCGRRGSAAPGICPGCTLVVRPIFSETTATQRDMPSATSQELASAIIDTVNAGARVVNLSATLAYPFSKGRGVLAASLDHAALHNVIVVAAAGNQATVGSSTISCHPWVVPVTGCDLEGAPTPESNLGNSIGRNGLMAPAQDITSLGTNDKPLVSGGTSAATPFVTGTIALLWSEFPAASASTIRLAIRVSASSRRTVVPPVLDAWAAYQAMVAFSGRADS